MTKKDYEHVAHVIRVMVGINPPLRRQIATSFADAFGDRYTNFNRDRFLAACGTTGE